MILAADFGGTTIKLGLVQDGSILARARFAVEAHRTMEHQLEAVATAWDTLLRAGGWSRRDCRGIALGVPFLVDVRRSRVSGEFGKYPGAATVDFGAWGLERLGLPVALENDLRLALLGEAAAGAVRGIGDAVMLAFGTGIGCAAISGGRLFRGAHNRAASLFGHSTICLNGPVGRCGNLGCAEDLASTATLTERARARADFAGSTLERAKKIDFEAVFVIAAQADACARALRDESLAIWAAVVQNAFLAFDPAVIVLGGGVMRSQQIILPAIREHVRRHMSGFPLEIPIVAAELADDAALLGAEIYFHQNPTMGGR